MTDEGITVDDYGTGTRYVLDAGDERVEVVEGTTLPPDDAPGDPDPPDVLVHDALRQTDERAGRRMKRRGDEATVAAVPTATPGDGLVDLLSVTMGATADLNPGWRSLDDLDLVGESTVVSGVDDENGPVLVLRTSEETLVHAHPGTLDGLDETLDDVGLDPATVDVHVRGTDAERVGVDEALAAAGSTERGPAIPDEEVGTDERDAGH